MSNYIYFQQLNSPLNQRFVISGETGDGYQIDGLKEWEEMIGLLLSYLVGERRDQIIEQILELNKAEQGNESDSLFVGDDQPKEELILVILLAKLRRRYKTLPVNRCPRVFISHRQSDTQIALRVAQIVSEKGFAFWLDIFDPGLLGLSAYPNLSKRFQSLLTACIIEMALINCTHIMACITPGTRGSMWVPYEYGRVTKIPGDTYKAAAWLHPGLPEADFPEYLLLGQITRNEIEIGIWLDREKQTNKPCLPVTLNTGVFAEIKSLPTNTDGGEPDTERNERNKITNPADWARTSRRIIIKKLKVRKPKPRGR